MALSVNSSISQLMKDPRAVQILESYLPGASRHPMLPMAMGMSLRQVAYEPQAQGLYKHLTEIDEKLKQLG
jgi:hypothetical protein